MYSVPRWGAAGGDGGPSIMGEALVKTTSNVNRPSIPLITAHPYLLRRAKEAMKSTRRSTPSSGTALNSDARRCPTLR